MKRLPSVPPVGRRIAAAVRHIDAGRLFEAAARRFDGKDALIAPLGRRSYGQLLERTGRVAAALHGLGAGRGDRVVLMRPNSIEFIEAWWGIVRAGAVVVPVNPRAPIDDLIKVLLSSQASVLVTCHASVGPHLDSLRTRFPTLSIVSDADGPGIHDCESLLAASAPLEQGAPLSLDEPCAMYFTAGSTGQPKGVLRSHQSVVWGLSMLARRLAPDDVLLARAPMAHTGGSLTGPFAVLIAGGTLVLPKATSVEAVLDASARHRVTHLYVHPTVFAKGLLGRLRVSEADLGSLKRLQWTAGPLPEPVRGALFERFPHLPLEVTFGMTEASNIASFDYPVGDRSALKAANCVGYPLPGAELRIVDGDGRSAPVGDEGEILIRTPTAFDGYWQDDVATAASITADGWFRTGDIGRLDGDGALYLSGRRREIIKSGGMTVHPAEVEQVLAEHPHVVDVAVFGLAHEDWDEAVVAVVSLRAAGELDGVDALLAHCRARLASYKLPKTIHILAELPRNASGKVDKRAIIAALAPAHQTA